MIECLEAIDYATTTEERQQKEDYLKTLVSQGILDKQKKKTEFIQARLKHHILAPEYRSRVSVKVDNPRSKFIDLDEGIPKTVLVVPNLPIFLRLSRAKIAETYNITAK